VKRYIRHIRAGNDERVQVHRDPAPPTSDNDDARALWGLLFKVGGSILLFVVVCQIIKALLLFLFSGALGWFALKVFCK
jgi:hypothetical protein